MSKKTFKAEVVKSIDSRTIKVKVTRSFMHPVVKKAMKRDKCFMVETHGKLFDVGSEITISESRPYSKTKTWEVVSATA